ncbi:hypothetical protein RSW84_25795, partial [Escherichia coli]
LYIHFQKGPMPFPLEHGITNHFILTIRYLYLILPLNGTAGEYKEVIPGDAMVSKVTLLPYLPAVYVLPAFLIQIINGLEAIPV